MKVILWMTMALNGVIARDNNEEDFISHDSWLLWLEYVRKAGCVIWGRKTHEIVKTWGKEYFDDLKGTRMVIVSSDPNYQVGEGFVLATSPEDALSILVKEGFTMALVTGGSGINSSFAKRNLLDEVMINIESVIVGKGIQLFRPEMFDLPLNLIEMKKSYGSAVLLHYAVKKKTEDKG